MKIFRVAIPDRYSEAHDIQRFTRENLEDTHDIQS